MIQWWMETQSGTPPPNQHSNSVQRDQGRADAVAGDIADNTHEKVGSSVASVDEPLV